MDKQLRTVGDDYIPKPNEGMFHQMDHTGDTKAIWDRNNPDEVEIARKQFKDFRAKGFLAFTVKGKSGDKGDKGEQMNEFDPDAEKVIFSPALRGG